MCANISILYSIVKKAEYEEKAKEIFGECGVTITTSGERHMGAVVGSETFKEKYVTEKVEKWVNDIEELSVIAKDEPQSALCSFVKAISHRWTYVQRTIPNISQFFAPLEEAIREKFIPAMVGRNISDIERRIFALPVRYGGMGISAHPGAESFPLSNLDNNQVTMTANGVNYPDDQDPQMFLSESQQEILNKFNNAINKITNNMNSEKDDPDDNIQPVDCKYYTLDNFKALKIKANKHSSILHINITSIQFQIEELRTILQLLDFKFDYICISESKIIINTTPQVDIGIEGYQTPVGMPTHSSKGGQRSPHLHQRRNKLQTQRRPQHPEAEGA